MKTVRYRLAGAVTAVAALTVISACGSSGSSTGASGSGAAGGKATVTLLVDNADTTVKAAQAEINAFEKVNPDIVVTMSTRPQGTDGDNVIKTKLATGDMQDVFWYNSGSLLQALSPAKNLVDLTNDPVLKDTLPSFLPTVTQDGKVYGAPWGTASGGGIVYNKAVFDKLGLQVPTTWAAFEANNAKIKAAGIYPLLGTFGDTWTSQLFVLGDYCNVAATDPTFVTDYTANKAKYATSPAALRGFEKTAEPNAKGWLNNSAGSLKLDQGLKLLISGRAAQYPILTSVVAALPAAQASKLDFFGIPGDVAGRACATVWPGAGQYIPKATKNLAAAKKFVAFVASPAGTVAYSSAVPPTGPYLVKGATLGANPLPLATDLETYINNGNVSPALEFLSPVKGPSLEQFTVAVESGQTSAQAGAQQYDADITKEAKQLNLPGW